MGIQINNTNNPYPDDKNVLKFKTAEQLGGSIFFAGW